MVDTLWAQLKQAKQPLLWLGGGASVARRR
jgi:acetolactate synthase-1/2/3 large subunit